MNIEAIEGMNIFLPSAASSLDSTAGAWCLCRYTPSPPEAALTKKFPPAYRMNVTVAWWNVRGGSAAAQKEDRCRSMRIIAMEFKHFTNKQCYRNSAKKRLSCTQTHMSPVFLQGLQPHLQKLHNQRWSFPLKKWFKIFLSVVLSVDIVQRLIG